jgi:hypothetical protein
VVDPKLVEPPASWEVAELERLQAKLEKAIPRELKKETAYVGALMKMAVETAYKRGVAQEDLAAAIFALLTRDDVDDDDRRYTARLCDDCDHVGPHEHERCERCGGPTWEIFEAQRAIGRAMHEVRAIGFTLLRCRCCSMFVMQPPGQPPGQCTCGALYMPHQAKG